MKRKKELASQSDDQSLAKQPAGQSLAKQPASQSPAKENDLKDALQYVVDVTGDAKKAAADNPFTSSGKPKSELCGAAIITNKLKEEGIEAHKRGIVPQPNMEGGLKNNDMHVAAEAALKMIELSEQQPPSLPD